MSSLSHSQLISVVVVVVAVFCGCWRTGNAQVCAPVDGSSCKCRSNRGFIDLTSLAYPEDSSYRTEYNGNTYYFNPCNGLKIGDGSCASNTAVCQEASDGTRSCGTLSSERMIEEAGNNILVHYADGNGGRISAINLICDPSVDKATFTAVRDDFLRYEFDFKSKCLCPDTTCTPPSGGKSSGSGGGVAAGPIGIVLIFLSIASFIAYFVFGILLRKFHFKKEGSDVIPQKAFWFNFPFLVKDGFVFTFNPIVQRIRGGGKLPEQ